FMDRVANLRWQGIRQSGFRNAIISVTAGDLLQYIGHPHNALADIQTVRRSLNDNAGVGISRMRGGFAGLPRFPTPAARLPDFAFKFERLKQPDDLACAQIDSEPALDIPRCERDYGILGLERIFIHQTRGDLSVGPLRHELQTTPHTLFCHGG